MNFQKNLNLKQSNAFKNSLLSQSKGNLNIGMMNQNRRSEYNSNSGQGGNYNGTQSMYFNPNINANI